MSTNIMLPHKKDILVYNLRFVFDFSRTGPITLNRTEDIGKYICSMVRSSQLPVKQIIPENYHNVEWMVPDNTFSIAKKHFLYCKRENIEMINDHLMANFSIFFRWFLKTVNDIGIGHKDLLKEAIFGFKNRYQ